jgi:hypothetical protein
MIVALLFRMFSPIAPSVRQQSLSRRTLSVRHDAAAFKYSPPVASAKTLRLFCTRPARLRRGTSHPYVRQHFSLDTP